MARDVEDEVGDDDEVFGGVTDPAQTTEDERAEMMAGDSGVESSDDSGSSEGSAPEVTPESAPTEWESVREAAAGLGYKFDPSIQDDRGAIADLVRSALSNRQADYYAQLGRQLAPHADRIGDYLRQQQAPPTPTGPKPWERPEFDKRWAALVEQDPATGLYIGKAGVPADVVEKVNRFAEWRSKYEEDPIGVARLAWQEDARKVAQEVYAAQFAQMRREAEIDRIVSQNSSWLYQANEDGSRVTDPVTGRAVYTPLGSEYIRGLEEVRAAGVTDPGLQDRLAQELVRGRDAQRKLASGQKVAKSKAAVTQPNRNPLQALSARERRATPGATEPSRAGLSLTDMLRMDMSDVEDEEIFGSGES